MILTCFLTKLMELHLNLFVIISDGCHRDLIKINFKFKSFQLSSTSKEKMKNRKKIKGHNILV